MRTTEPATLARRAQGEESRERLIGSAIAAISERGYAATSVGDICRSAGVAKTALYWHFDSKEGLLAVVLERVGNSWIEQIQKSVYMEGDPLQRLDRLFEGWRQILDEQPHLLRLLLFLQLGSADTSDDIRGALENLVTRATDALAQGIEDSVGGGVQDLDLVSHTILTLMEGAVLQRAAEQTAEQRDRLFGELKRTVILVLWDRLPSEVRAQFVAQGETPR